MSLTSLPFFLFFAASIVIYYVIPKKFQWTALLLFSFGFFLLSSKPYTLIYLAISLTFTTLCTRWISRGKVEHNSQKAKKALILGVIVNVGILALLKYNGFVINNVNRIFSFAHVSIKLPSLDLASPIGISFYTLTVVGYLLDTYWGIAEPQPSLLKTALFVGYYPQLISGPITRYGQMGSQFSQSHKFDYETVIFGLQRMLWGSFKKLVISTRLGIVVDTIYGNTEQYPGLYIWLAAALFMFQLYTDFSGCMDIIIGASECYGIVLPENFRTPFFSHSVQEYWQRWHITMGSWLRDYIMYPLQRTKVWRKLTKWTKARFGKKAAKQIPSYLGMLCVWLLIGLWHGGSWKYIFGMGIWFWFLITSSQILDPYFKKLTKRLGINTTCFSWSLFQFLRVFVLVAIGNIFFRINSFINALRTIKAGFLCWNPWIFFDGSLYRLGLDRANFLLMVIGLAVLLLVSALQEKKGSVRKILAKQNIIFRWFILFALIFSVILFGIYGPGYNAQSFIYEQF